MRSPRLRHALGFILAMGISIAAADSAAAAPAAAPAGFRPMALAADGAPVAWACGAQNVHLYKPPTARHADVIREALAEVSALVGVKFAVAGTSAVSPWTAKTSDAKIIIGFDTFDAKYAGWARHEQRGAGWVRGRVTLNLAVAYVATPKTESDWARYENTVLHEIGHLVGLAHVDARAEAMFGQWNTGRTTYGRGDRAGIAAVGCRQAAPAVAVAAR